MAAVTYGIDGNERTYATLFAGAPSPYSSYGPESFTFVPQSTGMFDPSVDEEERRPNVRRMFLRYKGAPTGKNIYKLNDSTITERTPSDMDDVAEVFWFGHNNVISVQDAALLIAAGYTLTSA